MRSSTSPPKRFLCLFCSASFHFVHLSSDNTGTLSNGSVPLWKETGPSSPKGSTFSADAATARFTVQGTGLRGRVVAATNGTQTICWRRKLGPSLPVGVSNPSAEACLPRVPIEFLSPHPCSTSVSHSASFPSGQPVAQEVCNQTQVGQGLHPPLHVSPGSVCCSGGSLTGYFHGHVACNEEMQL